MRNEEWQRCSRCDNQRDYMVRHLAGDELVPYCHECFVKASRENADSPTYYELHGIGGIGDIGNACITNGYFYLSWEQFEHTHRK